MKIARYAFLASLVAAAVVACSESGPLSPKDPKQPAGNLAGTSGNHDSSNTTPPPTPDPWPRTVIGTVLGAQFSGGDTTSTGPIVNATVTLYQGMIPGGWSDSSGTKPADPQPFRTATTNASGQFTFADLPENNYWVTITPAAGSPYYPALAIVTPPASVSRLTINLTHQ